MVIQLLVLATVAPLSAQPACQPSRAAQYERKADLPPGVLLAFGAPIAERDQPYQESDVIGRDPLPPYRFVHAERRDCELIVTYEHGGRGHGLDQARLVADQAGWKRVDRLTFEPRTWQPTLR